MQKNYNRNRAYNEPVDLEKLALGDHDAFRRLFVNFYPKIKQFILCLVKSETVAEDLSQDIFEYLWMNRDLLPNLKSLNDYLFRMAKNKAINHLNREILKKNYVSSHVNMQEYWMEEEIYAGELNLLVELTVKKMPEQRRRIFQMSRVTGLKNNEIAKSLNISLKTVENHLNLALRKIRQVIHLSILFFL
jgi:RNA polymerase sigma-70 factor (ECF subfamily)